MPAAPHLALDRQRRVHLAARAIGADGQQALSRPLGTGAGLERGRRLANVEQSTSGALGGGVHTGDVGEPRMQTAGHVEAVIEGVDDGRDPVFLHETALVGDAQDQRAGRRAARLRQASSPARPMSALQPSRRTWPMHHSGRQMAIPLAVLAASASRASPRNNRYGGSIVTAAAASLLCSASRRARSADSAAAYSALAHTRSSPAA